jgi:hypothetical protein
MYWHQLAEDYPTAMTALLEARDQAESSYLNSGYDVDRFRDLAALNEKLDEQQRTVEILKQMSQEDIDAATSVYIFAEPALVNQRPENRNWSGETIFYALLAAAPGVTRKCQSVHLV